MKEITTVESLMPISQFNINKNGLAAISHSSIEDYITYVNTIPMLDETEELECTEKLQKDGDLQAAHRLVVAHLRYVVKVAKKYLGYGLPLADLIQEGTVGLMKAVRKFDPARHVRLVTFALHWIKAEIHEFILKNWRIVKIATTKAQRKLFFKLKSSKKSLNWLSNQEISQVAADLKVSAKDVRQMEMRIFSHDNSFDSLYNPTQENALVPANYLSRESVADFNCLEDNRFNPEIILEKSEWEIIASAKLQEAIANLDSRSQIILHRRWLIKPEDEKATLEQLAVELGVSKERVRQLEERAIKALKDSF